MTGKADFSSNPGAHRACVCGHISYLHASNEACGVRGCSCTKYERSPAAIDFKTGLYEHYKGGLYVALGLVTHHHTRKPMVVYVSCKYGTTNVRPLEGWDRDEDGWIDTVINDAGVEVPRFKYVGPPIEGGG